MSFFDHVVKEGDDDQEGSRESELDFATVQYLRRSYRERASRKLAGLVP